MTKKEIEEVKRNGERISSDDFQIFVDEGEIRGKKLDFWGDCGYFIYGYYKNKLVWTISIKII